MAVAVRLDGPGSVMDGRIHLGWHDTAGRVLASPREKRIGLRAGRLRRRGFGPYSLEDLGPHDGALVPPMEDRSGGEMAGDTAMAPIAVERGVPEEGVVREGAGSRAGCFWQRPAMVEGEGVGCSS